MFWFHSFEEVYQTKSSRNPFKIEILRVLRVKFMFSKEFINNRLNMSTLDVIYKVDVNF